MHKFDMGNKTISLECTKRSWFELFVWILLICGMVIFKINIREMYLLNDKNSVILQDSVSLRVKKNASQQIYGVESQAETDPCVGRYIYAHDLPSRFNDDIIKNCSRLIKWFGNMCPFVSDMGLGPPILDSQGVLQGNSWYLTNQFMLEIIFHSRMKQYNCLTNNSSLASAIYVPFYAGLDVGRYLWDFNTSIRDSAPCDLLNWLTAKPEWKYMNGKDHFLVAGRTTWDFRRQTDDSSDWGNKLFELPEAKNMILLIIESCSTCNKVDISIPYPTSFHPLNDLDVYNWQGKVRKVNRQYLYVFVGASRPKLKDPIRSEIIDQCLASKKTCKWFDCSLSENNCEDPTQVMGVFQSSRFCLQPPGDSPTRRSTFESILAGCIPVFFRPDSAYTQYLWHLPANYNKYSVFIPESDINVKKVKIEEILSRISDNEVIAMREEVVRLIPRVVYSNPMARLEDIEDAFDIAINGVIEKVEEARKSNERTSRGN